MLNCIEFLVFLICVVPGHCCLTLRVPLPSQPQSQLLLRLKIVWEPGNDFNELLMKTTGICAIFGFGGILNTSVKQQKHKRQNWFSLFLLRSTQLFLSMKEMGRKARSHFLIPKHFQSVTTKAKCCPSKLCVNPDCRLQPGRQNSGSCLSQVDTRLRRAPCKTLPEKTLQNYDIYH